MTENPLREVSGQGPRRERMLTWTLRSRRYIEERWTVTLCTSPTAADGTTERQKAHWSGA